VGQTGLTRTEDSLILRLATDGYALRLATCDSAMMRDGPTHYFCSSRGHARCHEEGNTSDGRARGYRSLGACRERRKQRFTELEAALDQLSDQVQGGRAENQVLTDQNTALQVRELCLVADTRGSSVIKVTNYTLLIPSTP